MTYLTAAFYKFVTLDDAERLRDPLLAACNAWDIRGTILLANEGINGTVAGTPDNVGRLLRRLKDDPRLADLEPKFSETDHAPFLRMKVRLKREIVSMGVSGIDPATQAGTYVAPEDWNALVSEPDVITIDARNDYEVAVGTFSGAVNPNTERFGDLPQWLEQQEALKPDTRIAMFCTGGIRCEKSTALLKSRGFDNVYHLQGGILKYLETVPAEDSLWQGECFVFDERVSVNHKLERGSYALCRACRRPVSKEERESPHYVPGVSCANCHDQLSDEQLARYTERQRQVQLARERGEAHLGLDAARRLKSQSELRELPVLYSFRRCPYAMRARLALRSAGIVCALREVVLRDKPDAMLEASPKGSVPVLVTTEGRVIDESLDLMLWALEQSDPDGWLTPDRNAMLQLVARADGEFKHHLDRYKYPNRYNDCDAEQHREAGAEFLRALERQLAGKTYLFGEQPALADMAIAPFVRQFAMTDTKWFDAQPWPALSAWLKRFTGSTAFADIMLKYPQWHEGDAVTRF